MILDEQSMFSKNQAITASAASENILDTGKGEPAFGTPVELFIQVTETFNNLTSLTIKVQTCENESFTSPVDLAEETIPLASLTKGHVANLKYLPKGNLGFMRLYYTVTGAAPSTGKILAGIADGIQESFHNI